MIKKILWPQLMPPRAPKNVLPKIYNLLSVLRQIQQVMIEVSRLRLEIHQKYLKTLIVLLGALFPYLSLLKIPRSLSLSLSFSLSLSLSLPVCMSLNLKYTSDLHELAEILARFIIL
jgi:hypothetical protein